MKILYVGHFAPGENAYRRAIALRDLGHHVVGVTTGGLWDSHFLARNWQRLMRRVFPRIKNALLNATICRSVKDQQYDMAWVDKGTEVRRETLRCLKRRLPSIVLVSFCSDDMLNPNNMTVDFLASLPNYDYHITTKSFNVAEFQVLGAKKVLMVDNGFCEHAHRPEQGLPEEARATLGGDVGFIGYWEKERAGSIVYLAENGVNVRVWGPWKNSKKVPNLLIEGRPAWEADYAKAIGAFKVNLCFLRKENRDLQTTRSVEIPACGGFMLAERTSEHLSLFKEGEEAEFFDSREEMLRKCKYYLKNEEQRKRVALAGYHKTVTAGYSNRRRLDLVLRKIAAEKGAV